MNVAEKVQRFLDEEGLSMKAHPEFVSRDDGTFSVVVRVTVVERPKPTQASDLEPKVEI